MVLGTHSRSVKELRESTGPSDRVLALFFHIAVVCRAVFGLCQQSQGAESISGANLSSIHLGVLQSFNMIVPRCAVLCVVWPNSRSVKELKVSLWCLPK